MIEAFKMIYKNRISIERDITEEDVRSIIKSELLDEYTHPRAKLSIERKLSMALARVNNSNLSQIQKEMILSVMNEEYVKLSIGLKN